MSEPRQSPADGLVVEGLDPSLGALGTLVGLLDPVPPGDRLYALRTAWFEDPLTPLLGITDRHRELLELIVSFLGSAESSRLGGSRHWHGIEVPGDDGPAPTGLYLTTDPPATGGAGANGDAPCRLGLGAIYEPFADDDASRSRHPISAAVVLELPLLDLASGDFLLAPGREPIALAVQLRGREAFAAESPAAVTLSGLDLTAALHLDAAPDVDLVLRDFSLAGAKPENLSVVELAKDPGQLVGEGLRALVSGALHAATKAAVDDKTRAEAMESDLRWLLGLPTAGDGSPIQEVPWGDLASSRFGQVWADWFESIVTDPEKLKAWLHGVYCLTRGLDVAQRQDQRGEDLGGEGTEEHPFAVPIFGGGEGGPSFELTMAVSSNGHTRLTPGLRLTSPAVHPADDVDFFIEARAQLARISLGGSSSASLDPLIEISANARHQGGEPLFSYTADDPSQSLSPDRFSAGIRLDPDADTKLAPFADFVEPGGKQIGVVDLWRQANPTGNPLDWLLDQLGNDELWEQVFTQLLPEDSGLAYRDRGIEYRHETPEGDGTEGERPSPLKLRAAVEGERGLALAVDAHAAVDWLALSLAASLRLDDLTQPGPPRLTFEASLGGAKEGGHPMPRLTASLGEDGAFELVAELPLTDGSQPLRLSLVPFKGFQGFSLDQVWPLLEGAVLDHEAVKSWLESPLKGDVPGCTWASILTKWGLFPERDDGKYRFPEEHGNVDLKALRALRPDKLIEVTLSEFLSQVDELKLLPIGEHGSLNLTHDKSRSRYGVRLAVSDLVVAGGKKKPANGKAAEGKGGTTLTLQAGKWMSKETDEDNWLRRSWKADETPPAGGIHLDLLAIDSGRPVFSPALKLVSVGLDVAGSEKKPLVDVKGYRVEGIQSRLYLDAGSGPVEIGGGVRFDRAALPLGPSTGASKGSKNPVASGLVSSGGGKGAGDPVNPVFGVQLSYVREFDARILSEGPEAGGKVWIPVKKSFGPLYCRKVGLGFDDDKRLLVGYDGSVALGPLGVDLIDLSVGIPLTHPQDFSDYSLDLGGLDLTFKGGPVEIGGSFLESRTPDGEVQYTGAAMIKTEAFSISGIGSYAVVDGDPSMFVFAVLDKDLGGPNFFFVTALAAGFGFKRKLKLPSIEQVQDFPLVRVIQDPGYIGKSPDPKTALTKINESIPPDPSSYWLAVGVKFRSFEQVETVAMLTVAFGSELSIAILGLSTLTIPPRLPKEESPVCYAELALRAEFNPSVGVLSVEARLTSNSYIFEKECKLTGGFAFFTWFSGDHEGDFVITLGGYHRKFVPPSHYPVVPRVGIDWKRGDVRIVGGLYFALTPSCLMAGGKLDAVWDGGWAKAWFIAYADFLISWKPFHYDIAIGVTIGASATIEIDVGLFSISKTFTFEFGADVNIWGPPFAGKARVKYLIVSFTVRFGPQGEKKPDPIEWSEFRESFLPNPKTVCGVVFTGGLLQEWQREDGTKIPIVNGHELAFNVQSKAPCTAIGWKGAQPPTGHDGAAGRLGVTPMYASDLTSKMSVELKDEHGDRPAADLFEVSVVTKGFPDAMWGRGEPTLDKPTSKVIPNVPAGVSVVLSERGKQGAVRHSLPAMKLKEFAYERIGKTIPWAATPTPKDIPAQLTRTLANTLWGNDEVNETRAGVLAALGAVTPHPLNEVSLAETAASVETLFQAEPTFATLGQLLPEER